MLVLHFSTKINFILFLSEPDGKPQNVSGRNTSSTSISVSWEEVQADLQNGIITGYNITYQSLTENDNGFVTAGPNDRQANLTELKKFVEYSISVVVFTVKGDGPPFVFIVRTDQDSKSYNTFFLSLLLLQSFSAFVHLLFFSGYYRNAWADVMISSIDVYVLTISTFLSVIVAVVVAMKALGHLINPSCPQPLFQSGVKRKAIA